MLSGKLTLSFDMANLDEREEGMNAINSSAKGQFIWAFQSYLRQIYKYESDCETFTEKEYELIDRIYTDWFRIKEECEVSDE